MVLRQTGLNRRCRSVHWHTPVLVFLVLLTGSGCAAPRPADSSKASKRQPIAKMKLELTAEEAHAGKQVQIRIPESGDPPVGFPPGVKMEPACVSKAKAGPGRMARRTAIS